ncbi:NlpC/P60 family protein [Pseudomonas sp. TWI929]|uniref:NlpC/P60 family protein n=1 Tax=Pseudomonas sp. TWI929 TaxID=3136795 RepID=UPI00320ADC26
MENISVRKIQEALVAKGFIPGEVDGIWGRRTIAAVKRFQQSAGLDADGIVGPKTSAALFSGAPAVPSQALLPWIAEAENLIGTKENLGSRSNPVILNWADNLDIHYANDDVPWCGLFVAHCVGSSMPDEILPANPLGARQWERFGDPIDPRWGAILVFWRESKESGKGHVGFYAGEDDSAYRVLGGNQSNKVCLAWVAKNRFLRARWPRTAASLGGGSAIVQVDRQEDLSKNEA